MGGVVNLLPMRPGPGSYTEAALEGGTFGTLNGSALYARGLGRFDALVSLSGQSTDGYLLNSRGLPMNWDGRSGFVNLGYGDGRARARLYGLYFHGRGTDEDFRRVSRRFSQDLDLTLDLDPAHGASANLRMWYAGLSQDFDWFAQPDAEWRQHTVGAIATQRYTAGSLLGLTGGVEVRRQSALVVDGADTVDEGTTLWGLFLQNRLTLGETATVLLGVRGDGRPAGGVEPSFRAGANLALDAHTTLLAAVGRAFRVPTISDRVLPRTSFFGLEFEGNPDLEPESASSAELGLRRGVGSATVTLTGFVTHARDFWDFLPGDDGVFRPRNIARVRIRGLESELRAGMGGGLEARASYTFTDARYRTFVGSEAAEGNRLDDNVRHAAALALVWRHPSGHAVRLASRALGDRATDPFDPPDSRLPGFAVVDLTTAWSLDPRVRIHLGVLNLLDHGYRLRPEFPQPRRALVAGVRAAWLDSPAGD
jgi:outer membrane cobalamin receptor